ncbi:MAG TPA: glycosyl transferase, partial [Roseiflexaceae bacterium]|nr:glycosyl transferase [Roseiflexaceae bacterium]
MIASVWLLTHSYVAIQLVIPLAGAGTVLLVYAWTYALFDKQAALLAAGFLACFPLFREYSSTAYTETLSALVLTAALWAYWRGWTVLTVLGGALCAYTKLDLLFLYAGVVTISLLFMLIKRREAGVEQRAVPWFGNIRYHIIALA